MMHKLKYFDGLRGLASFMVVCHHFLVAFLPAHLTGNLAQTNIGDGSFEIWFSTSVFNILFNGSLAVSIFFVLSGYVLTSKYFQNNNISILTELAFKRYLRLSIPVFFTVVVVALLIKYSCMYNVAAAEITKSDWWLGSFWLFDPNIKNVLYTSFAGVLFYNDTSYNTVFWTMGLELFGSWIILSVAALSHSLNRKYLIYFAVLLYFLITANFFYMAFVLGMCLSFYENCIPNKPAFFDTLFFKFISVICIVIFGSYPSAGNIEATPYVWLHVFPYGSNSYFEHTISATFIIFLICRSAYLQRLLSLSIIRFLGDISFPMYLLHVPLIGSYGCFVFLRCISETSYMGAMLITFASLIPLLFLISMLMAKTVDNLSIQWPKNIFNQLFNKCY